MTIAQWGMSEWNLCFTGIIAIANVAVAYIIFSTANYAKEQLFSAKTQLKIMKDQAEEARKWEMMKTAFTFQFKSERIYEIEKKLNKSFK